MDDLKAERFRARVMNIVRPMIAEAIGSLQLTAWRTQTMAEVRRVASESARQSVIDTMTAKATTGIKVDPNPWRQEQADAARGQMAKQLHDEGMRVGAKVSVSETGNSTQIEMPTGSIYRYRFDHEALAWLKLQPSVRVLVKQLQDHNTAIHAEAERQAQLRQQAMDMQAEAKAAQYAAEQAAQAARKRRRSTSKRAGQHIGHLQADLDQAHAELAMWSGENVTAAERAVRIARDLQALDEQLHGKIGSVSNEGALGGVGFTSVISKVEVLGGEVVVKLSGHSGLYAMRHVTVA